MAMSGQSFILIINNFIIFRFPTLRSDDGSAKLHHDEYHSSN